MSPTRLSFLFVHERSCGPPLWVKEGELNLVRAHTIHIVGTLCDFPCAVLAAALYYLMQAGGSQSASHLVAVSYTHLTLPTISSV